MFVCPLDSQLESQFDGLLADLEQHGEFVAHLESCTVCQARLEFLLDQDESTSRRYQALSPRPDRGSPPPPTFLDAPSTVRSAERLPVTAVPGYEVLERLGHGGMGVVYKARHLKLNRLVALKMIRAQIASPEQRQRFQIEAEAVARLQHPNIVQIYEVAELKGSPCLALELVAGGSLESRLGKEPMAPAEAARILRLLARAVAHAHARGIVHRDLKPDNVLLAAPVDEANLNTALGCPKITDFGLARLAVDGPRLTRAGMMVGTPAYMAPEQADALEAGAEADVYSLGVILYRLLAGRCPFESSSLSELLYLICHRPPPSLRKKVPGVPESLERLCLACLEKEPARRPSAPELARRLDEFLRSPGGSPTSLPRRRWLVSACLIIALLLVPYLWLALPAFLPMAPLTVKSLRVHHYAGENDEPPEEMGYQSPAARFGDCVSVTVEFSEPAYFYLIEFNFAGKEQLIWPGDSEGNGLPGTTPRKQRQVRCPASPRSIWLDEEDAKSGLQAYVVVASARPLPPYADWKKQRGKVNWTKRPPGNTVWLADPDSVSVLLRGRRERSKVRLAGKGPTLDELCRSMRTGGIETVKALAFPVLPKEER
jgi:serine/threonine protein kinase